MSFQSLLIFVPSALLLLAWCLVLSKRRGHKIELAALGAATVIVAWALSLYIRMLMHPEYASPPPWQDPLNLDAGLLMLAAPIAIVLGIVAAAKRAPWWLVALVELISLPLMLVGCAAAVSV